MQPQGPDLNECEIESGVTAPQARNFAFVCHTTAIISFFHLFPTYQAPGATFVWRFGEAPNDMLAPLLRF